MFIGRLLKGDRSNKRKKFKKGEKNMENVKNENITPEQIFQTSFGFAPARVLVSGIDLEVFTHIANGKHRVEEIADAIPADRRGVEILLNALVGLNFLIKTNGAYDLTPVSENFLVKGKPAYFGEFAQHVDLLWEPWQNLTEIIRTGKPFQYVENEGEAFFQKLVPKLFVLSYSSAKVAVDVLEVGKKWKNLKILDVGAGSAAWSIAFAETDKGTKVTAQDWPSILKITEEFVNKFGLANRYDYLSEDLRDVDFGRNSNLYDLAILGHICHSEGAERSKELISRISRVIKKGGKILIGDFIVDEDRSKAVFPLLFAVNMLTATENGNTFTLSEYTEWLKNAGFVNIRVIDANGASIIIADKV